MKILKRFSGGEKMRNPSGQQCENERVKNNRCEIFSIKRVTKKFLEVSRCGRAKQRQRYVQKKCAERENLFFC